MISTCHRCGQQRPVRRKRGNPQGQYTCYSCAPSGLAKPCWFCGQSKPVAALREDGQPVCLNCYRKKFNLGICRLCGKERHVLKPRNGKGPICRSCANSRVYRAKKLRAALIAQRIRALRTQRRADPKDAAS